MRNAYLTLIVFVFLPITAWSADMYSVNSGATVQINEHGVCQRITNGHASGQRIMVPTRTATEWTTFRNNRPAGVGMAACPPVCSGVSVGGYCWYLGAVGQSCTQVCSSRGGVNIAGTRNYAGSGGTNAQCQSVLNALGQTGGVNQLPCEDGMQYTGCIRFSLFFGNIRCTGATTTDVGSYSAASRACACNN